MINRIGEYADGWFVLCSPDQYPQVKERIEIAARTAGRDPASIGSEAGVAVVGSREHEWKPRVEGWHAMGLTHLCLRTLGGGLEISQHLKKMTEAVNEIPISLDSE